MEKSVETGKRFLEWIRVKIVTHNKNKVPEYFAEGDVWWCKIGENIGIEISGKNKNFSRPVLILTKFNNLGAAVIPLTTKPRFNSPYYTPFEFNGAMSFAALSQERTISTARLYKKCGSVDGDILKQIRRDFLRLHGGH